MHNILGYTDQSLYLQILIHLYKQTLDPPNITYIVKEIILKNFKELDILVP